MAQRLAPATTGPSVMTAQYTSARCGSGRWRVTCQMSLNALSIVMISNSEVTSRKAPPMAVSREAWRANWFRYSMMLSETDGGIRLLARKSSSATRNSWNTGKAVNNDSTTASMGTMASTVVKVRLDATCSSFSSSARWDVKRQARRTLVTQDARGDEGAVAADAAAAGSAGRFIG